MSTRAPRSYDEIVRHTVRQPDGSWRDEPPPGEEELRTDRQIRHDVTEALVAYAIDTIGFEVSGGRLIVRGWVGDQEAATRVVRIISQAAPEAVIESHLHIGRLEG
ncbi:MAG: hypothetical protein JWP01_1469 [Myxococcales bacterium]|nr:hypothetical protein [Myxococcales bacterium]